MLCPWVQPNLFTESGHVRYFYFGTYFAWPIGLFWFYFLIFENLRGFLRNIWDFRQLTNLKLPPILIVAKKWMAPLQIVIFFFEKKIPSKHSSIKVFFYIIYTIFARYDDVYKRIFDNEWHIYCIIRVCFFFVSLRSSRMESRNSRR